MVGAELRGTIKQATSCCSCNLVSKSVKKKLLIPHAIHSVLFNLVMYQCRTRTVCVLAYFCGPFTRCTGPGRGITFPKSFISPGSSDNHVYNSSAAISVIQLLSRATKQYCVFVFSLRKTPYWPTLSPHTFSQLLKRSENFILTWQLFSPWYQRFIYYTQRELISGKLTPLICPLLPLICSLHFYCLEPIRASLIQQNTAPVLPGSHFCWLTV